MSISQSVFHSIWTVLWEKWIEFRHEWQKITLSAVVSPLLYMIALGWGLGASTVIGDHPYIDFLVPGILAMTSMSTSFSAVAQPLSVQRLYEHSFDQVMISPTPMRSYIFGHMLGGALRGLYGGALILLLSIPFGASMHIDLLFFLMLLLSGLTFGAMGVLAALLSSSHTDIPRFNALVMLPMTFLCNTIFPAERVPSLVRGLIQLLPLTHISSALRTIAYGGQPHWIHFLVPAIYAVTFLLLADLVLLRRKNL